MKSHALVASGLLALAFTQAQASSPTEKVVCTDQPRAQWMSEQQARALFKAPSYLLVKFKVSKGRCHEFYAVEHDGTVVEAYLHPVTGEVIRMTRVPPQPGAKKP
ncbi:PepSY domain-containing protein [Hydrogenophaga flava]|uniref:PepSY domain-containing protein n=1 Tax=Hydrogenophaga flava TaxID=65657 RepID=UPI0008271AB7|nr:PepSY domain-containing protein [Hydrogenophaga flava]